MRHARQNKLVNILKNSFEPFASEWRFSRKRGANIPGLDSRKHWKRFNALVVIRDPVHNFVTVLAKLLRVHVKRRLVLWQGRHV